MIENITAHLDTILILISIFAGYRMLKSDLSEKINHMEDKLNHLTDRVNSLIKDLSYLTGRFDQVFPSGKPKTAA